MNTTVSVHLHGDTESRVLDCGTSVGLTFHKGGEYMRDVTLFFQDEEQAVKFAESVGEVLAMFRAKRPTAPLSLTIEKASA